MIRNRQINDNHFTVLIKHFFYLSIHQMKILLINGSHRKGNTQYILSTMKKQIEQKGTDTVKLLDLKQKNIQFCEQADYNCDKTIGCESCCRDDMKDIYPLLQEADLIVFGSPIYFSNVSARIKNLMDRCNPYYFNGKLKGKFMVNVGVGESQNNKEFFDSLKMFGQTLGMKVADIFYVTGQAADTVQKNDKVVGQLKQFTQNVLLSSSKSLKKPKV